MTEKVESRLELLDAELERLVARQQGEWTDLVAITDLPFHRRIGALLKRTRFKVGADVFVYTPAEWKLMKVLTLLEGPDSEELHSLESFYIPTPYSDALPGSLPGGSRSDPISVMLRRG